MTDARVQDVRVTFQEELLYGPLAGLVRRCGNAATEATQAVELLGDALTAAREADELERGKVHPGPTDGRGRTPYTVWLEERYEEVFAAARVAVENHRRMAKLCAAQWDETRQIKASMQTPCGSGEPESGLRITNATTEVHVG